MSAEKIPGEDRAKRTRAENYTIPLAYTSFIECNGNFTCSRVRGCTRMLTKKDVSVIYDLTTLPLSDIT